MMQNLKQTTMKNKLAVFFTALLSLALLPQVAAHKYFFGLTEVSYNPRTQHVEAVHQYTLHDVQRALQKQYGDDFTLDNPNAEAQIMRWLENQFALFDSNDNKVKLNWVGFEADFQNIWLYQEVDIAPTDFCRWRVSNNILMREFAPQVNTVNFVTDNGTDGVTLTRENYTKAVNCQ